MGFTLSIGEKAPHWIPEEARANLVEALELFFESASPKEVEERLYDEVFIKRL